MTYKSSIQLKNKTRNITIRYRLPITRDIFLTLGECSLSIFLSFSEMFRFSWQCPHSFHMRLLRSLPGQHLRSEMSLATSGSSRYFVPFFLMPTSSGFPSASPTIMSSDTEGFSTFSKWGLAVMKSELQWIWLPSLIMVVLSALIRRFVLRQ